MVAQLPSNREGNAKKRIYVPLSRLLLFRITGFDAWQLDPCVRFAIFLGSRDSNDHPARKEKDAVTGREEQILGGGDGGRVASQARKLG